MAVFLFQLQGVTPTTIEATDKLQLAGGTFDSPIIVDDWNGSTHVESSVGADDSSANTPENNKFISQAGGGGGDSQADWGDGTEDIDAILNGECALKINFSDAASVATSAGKFYVYDGTTKTTAPTNLNIKAAEKGDTNFTDAEGSAAALTLTDQVAATSHDFYIILSGSPSAVGPNTGNKFIIELTYA